MMQLGGNSPWLQHLPESLQMVGFMPRDYTCLDSGSPVKLEKYRNAGRCGQLWEELETGLQRKICPGFKPRRGSHEGWNHAVLVRCGTMRFGGTMQFGGNHAVLGLPLPHGLGSRRDNAG